MKYPILGNKEVVAAAQRCTATGIFRISLCQLTFVYLYDIFIIDILRKLHENI